MKPIRLVFLALAASIAACAPVQRRADPVSSSTGPQVAGVGDVLLRLDITENLPNAFGGADIFGRRRDRGYVELRYAGLLPDGRVVLHRKDVEVLNTETTMSRTGVGFATTQGSVRAAGNVASVQGTTIYTTPQRATVLPLPPDSREIVLDLKQSRTLPVSGRTIEVLEAQPHMIQFIAR